MKKKLPLAGYSVTTVSTAEAALHQLNGGGAFDLILSDIQMPRMSGLELLSQLKTKKDPIPVILMTAHGSLETAIQAMRAGAFDYIVKPLHLDDLQLSIERALHFKRLERDNSALRSQVKEGWKTHEMIGKGHAIQSVFSLISRVAPTRANVLITGESGTGKELVARALHTQSQRCNGPFIAINCSAIPAELLESELFGHAKGAFTGAHQSKRGLFEEANEGSIFLDEIGDMELSLQAKLLRVIQERKVKPVGENQPKDINVRIIAATHKDLRVAIQENLFREDLYYRLCVIPLELPALRQRKEDIPLLADHFLKKYAAAHAIDVTSFTPQAISKLVSYHWPGNVRELENVIERSVVLATSPKISENDLPNLGHFHDPSSMLAEKASEFLSLEEMERQYIHLILRKTGGKKEKASQILGIDRKTLRRKIRDDQEPDTEFHENGSLENFIEIEGTALS